jgi:hypothetical protein
LKQSEKASNSFFFTSIWFSFENNWVFIEFNTSDILLIQKKIFIFDITLIYIDNINYWICTNTVFFLFFKRRKD